MLRFSKLKMKFFYKKNIFINYVEVDNTLMVFTKKLLQQENIIFLVVTV